MPMMGRTQRGLCRNRALTETERTDYACPGDLAQGSVHGTGSRGPAIIQQMAIDIECRPDALVAQNFAHSLDGHTRVDHQTGCCVPELVGMDWTDVGGSGLKL